MNNIEHIYLITVFTKCEPDGRWGYNIGSSRSVGWRPTFEMADETVKNNLCDIWEYCYNYACIEKLDYGLYPVAESKWYYKFNPETGKYEEMEEPVILKNRGPIGGIG